MRLYRALTIYEYDSIYDKYILDSNNRAFTHDIPAHNLNLLNEVYSHIMPTYKLPQVQKKRVIFSFTDDIKVACSFVTKNPKVYTAIGYIDIDVPKNPLKIESSNIYCIIPVYRVSDWIELAAFYDTVEIQNINYNRRTRLSHTLIPSRWGALSLACSAREYAIICSKLEPKLLLFEKDIRKEQENKQGVYDFDLGSNNKKNVINAVKKDIELLEISQKRKEYVIRNLPRIH